MFLNCVFVINLAEIYSLHRQAYIEIYFSIENSHSQSFTFTSLRENSLRQKCIRRSRNTFPTSKIKRLRNRTRHSSKFQILDSRRTRFFHSSSKLQQVYRDQFVKYLPVSSSRVRENRRRLSNFLVDSSGFMLRYRFAYMYNVTSSK